MKGGPTFRKGLQIERARSSLEFKSGLTAVLSIVIISTFPSKLHWYKLSLRVPRGFYLRDIGRHPVDLCDTYFGDSI
jgi:hypothetical protein